jgi:hypothetical protein
LTARATTKRIVVRAISDWIAINSFVTALSGIASVGLGDVEQECNGPLRAVPAKAARRRAPAALV